MKIRLGLYAIPFGFGPVSKAIAIAKAISKNFEIEWYLIGEGISLEFMKREGMNAHIVDTSKQDNNEGSLQDIINKIDAAIVLMDNDWANKLAPHIPVFFADSLGFMWKEEDFAAFPYMRNIEKYYVQDIFNSYENLLETGLRNLKPVNPIIDISYSNESRYPARKIIHLGGLLNPINPNTTMIYLQGISEIVNRMEIVDPLFLMSAAANQAFPSFLSDKDTKSLPHWEALSAIKQSDFVWSSPGLTLILEMAALRTKTAPLPPQNYSQVLNIKNMVRSFGNQLPEVWHFLNKEYSDITFGMPEEIGVKKITELNSKKLLDTIFQADFSQLAKQAYDFETKLPQELTFAGNGADEIAYDICAFFSKNQQHKK